MEYFCSDAFPLFIEHLNITMSYKLHTALWSYIYSFLLLPCSNWLNDSHPLSYCIRAYRLEPQYSHDIVEINHHWFGRCRIWRKHYTLLRLACAHRPDTLYIIATQKVSNASSYIAVNCNSRNHIGLKRWHIIILLTYMDFSWSISL